MDDQERVPERRNNAMNRLREDVAGSKPSQKSADSAETAWEALARYRALMEAFDGLIYICSEDLCNYLCQRTLCSAYRPQSCR